MGQVDRDVLDEIVRRIVEVAHPEKIILRTLAILLVVTTSVVQSEIRATEVATTTPISCGSSAVIPQM
ncbi:MAG: hypothetical protein DRI80_08525, partial [Chloroflexota bacterium]